MTSHVLEDKNAYLALVDRFPLVPIHGGRHLNQAIPIIDELTGREAPAAGEEQHLEVLSDLIERYEEERHPIGGALPVETLRFLMESNGLRQADLAHLFSSKSNISEVLAGRPARTEPGSSGAARGVLRGLAGPLPAYSERLQPLARLAADAVVADPSVLSFEAVRAD